MTLKNSGSVATSLWMLANFVKFLFLCVLHVLYPLIFIFCHAYTVLFSTLVHSHMRLEVYCNYLCLWTFQLWFSLFFTTMKNLQSWYLNLFSIINSVNWLLKLQMELLCMMIVMTVGPRIRLALAIAWVE